jgi:hypothetical protein
MIARGGEVEPRGREVRRFRDRIDRLARELGISKKLAAQMELEEAARARRTVRQIRSDVRKAVRS